MLSSRALAGACDILPPVVKNVVDTTLVRRRRRTGQVDAQDICLAALGGRRTVIGKCATILCCRMRSRKPISTGKAASKRDTVLELQGFGSAGEERTAELGDD